MDTRDFSIDTIEEIYDIIEELKKQGTFLDTVSDFWLRGEPDAVMLCTYAANGEMEEYYRKYADSMNLTKEKFQKIVENVRAVDKKYAEKFAGAKEEMQNFQTKLKNLAGEISMRTISLSSEEYRKAVEVLEGEDNEKKRKLEALIGVKRGNSESSAMEEKIREILKYSIGSGNLEDEIDVESTEAGISQKRKLLASVEALKEKFQKGKITQDELISEICDLYHVEDYGSKINYSLAVKKYQPEKKAAIVSDIFSTVLYIVGEDGIDAEKIEEIHQSVSAKSYIEDETWDMAEKAFRGVVVGVNAVVAAEYYGNVGSGGTTIDGLKVIDGKVDGKIPIEEYKRIRETSIHNPDSDSMTLGKYFDGTIESGSYVAKAEVTGDTYFSLGTKWEELESAYGLTDKDMFNLFNKTALDDAVAQGKTIRFSQNPMEWSGTALGDEWNYLKNKCKYTDLIEDGGYWYAIK